MYRRKGKYGAVWYIDKRLPAFGRFGPISTRTSRQRGAVRRAACRRYGSACTSEGERARP